MSRTRIGTEVRDSCASGGEIILRSQKKSLESLFVRLSDEEIAWIDTVVDMSGLTGSEIIETAIDAYLLIIVARQTLSIPALPDLAAKPGRHYLVSERSRRLLRSVSEQGGWSQNTIVRLALMWLKAQLGPSADGGAWAVGTPGIRLDKDDSPQ